MTSTIIRPVEQLRPDEDPTRLTYRPALDGLRAVAVLAVIVYHLDAPWLPGGFLGVDLFFVLSGALITALLLLEQETRGSIDRLRFWARRARRLLPAVLVLLVVVVPLARADVGIRGDALSTLGYAANWRFAAVARSYFADAAAMSPLNHMWSLAIEEQFYIVWPLLMGVLASRRKLAVGVMLALTGLSVAAMAWLYSPADPSQAYYHTLARAHELVVGALVALPLISTASWAVRCRRIARRLLPLAVAGIVVAFVAVADAAPPYYYGVSLAFSVAAAVLILGMEDDAPSRVRRVLSWRPLVRVGALSYALYLWHWPVIVFNRRAGLDGPELWAVTLAVTFAAAWLSGRFVEDHVRRGRLLGRTLTPRATIVSAGAAIVVTGVVLVAATPVSLQPAWARAEAGRGPTVVAPGAAAAAEFAPGAQDATGEPSASPSGPSGAPAGLPAGVTLETHGPEHVGPLPEDLVIGVVGDSAAASMEPGLAAAAQRRGHTLVSVAARGCPIVPELQVDEDGEILRYSQDCLDHVGTAFTELVSEHDPDVVVWYSGRDTLTHLLVDGEVLAPAEPAHVEAVEDGFDRAVEQLTSQGAELVIVRTLPRQGNLVGDCSRPLGQGTRFCDDIERIGGTPGQNLLYERLTDRHTDVRLISVAEVVCGYGETCDDAMTPTETYRTDLTHFGAEGAARVGEAIVERALAGTAAR